MKNQEETKRWKAKQLRYKKPIVRDLNLDKIQEDLWNITEECENIRWYTDSDDGNDSLINALDGDEDEAYEFKMAFADLCAECERMQEDLREEWIPNCFDIFFVAAGAGENFGGLLGWDSFEGDYFGIDGTDAWAEDEAKKKLKTMTKDELIAATRQCFKVYQSYIGLRNRYDSLKAAIDILRDQNTGFLQTIKEIERLYEAASKEQGITAKYSTEWKEFERYTDTLPQEAWISKWRGQNVNQRRQTRWLKDYHESYRKKLEERKNAVISEAEKEKKE